MIEFTHVNFIREKRHIIKDFSWHIQGKENWVILGLNGAGKSTLLQMMCGDLWPSSGQLRVLEYQFGKSSIPELRKEIGWVSSAIQSKFMPHEKAETIVLSGKFASIGIYQKTTIEDKERALEVLSDCSGERLIGKPYAVLSQGEKQIVMIARALMNQPRLLILDEPCTGLDLFAREELLNKINNITKKKNAPALLYVSHHTEEIMPCFQNVLLLKNGEINAKGKRTDMLTEDVLNGFYPAPVTISHLASERLIVLPQL